MVLEGDYCFLLLVWRGEVYWGRNGWMMLTGDIRTLAGGGELGRDAGDEGRVGADAFDVCDAAARVGDGADEERLLWRCRMSALLLWVWIIVEWTRMKLKRKKGSLTAH